MAYKGEGNPTGSPLEAAAGTAGPHATDAFKVLGNETRLAILLALWEAYDPHAERNAVPFTELRNRVGMRDSGQFTYHLDKLEGHFIRKTDDGYILRQPGLVFVQSIIAGIGIEEPTLELTEIDAPCPLCGAPTAITYENARVYQVCTDCEGWGPAGEEEPPGALFAWTFEPTGLSNRTAEEVFAASTIKTFTRIALRFEGICPECSGPVEWSFDICEDHDPSSDEKCPSCGREQAVLAREICTVCKSFGWGSPSMKVVFHPAVIAFYYARGIEVGFTGDTGFADVRRTLNLVEEAEEEVVSAEPLRVRITYSHEGDTLHLLLDEGMNVIDVSGWN